MRRRSGILATLALAVLWCGGCGIQPSAPVDSGPAPVIEQDEDSGQFATLYWILDDQLTALAMPVDTDDPDPSIAIELLIEGVPAELSDEFRTELPIGLALLSASETATEVTIEVGADLDLLTVRAIEQLACTAAANSTAVVTQRLAVSDMTVRVFSSEAGLQLACPVE